MDEIDRNLVAALEENARITLAELARKFRLMPRTVAERVRRLEVEGVIEGYHVAVNPAKAGFPIRAFVTLKAERDQYTAIIALARSLPEIKELHHAAGPDAFILRVIARDEAHLESLVFEFAQHGTADCRVIVSTPVQRFTT